MDFDIKKGEFFEYSTGSYSDKTCYPVKCLKTFNAGLINELLQLYKTTYNSDFYDHNLLTLAHLLSDNVVELVPISHSINSEYDNEFRVDDRKHEDSRLQSCVDFINNNKLEYLK